MKYLLSNPTRKKSFMIKFPTPEGNNTKMKISIQFLQNPLNLASLHDKENSDRRNRKPMVQIELKKSWENTQTEIQKDVNQVLKEIYKHYDKMYEQKMNVSEDFKKARLFTEKDRLNFIHKRFFLYYSIKI